MTNSKNIFDHLLLIIFIMAVFGSIGVIWHFQKISPPTKPMSSISSFWNLEKVLWKNGRKAYFTEKKSLRNVVKYSLENNKNEIEAGNIALYLFPELLDDLSFEKFEAKELWQEHQKYIEENPHTKLSRNKFIEMEANIWNFENPSRNEPQISLYAKEVIKIFNVLSSEQQITKN